jgi:cytochrome oxidase Cu insertion factor (SCO1/SenC/PrrC family)
MRNALLAAALVLGAASLRAADAIAIPDVTLLDQNGTHVALRSLMNGKIAAVNFIFTSCTTICSPMGANFAAVQTLVEGNEDVALISISIDPRYDTPRRLKAWSSRFNAGPKWRLLTGDESAVKRALAAFRIDANLNHAAIVVVVNSATGKWTRGNGLAPPKDIVAMIDALRAGKSAEKSAARTYFTDVELVDQEARPHRFYSDLLRGKTVVINAFFGSCQGSCPVMAGKLAAIQTRFGDRLGKDLSILSISVDPTRDTPSALKSYAGRFHAAAGWYFLTGKKENIDFALQKIGQYVEQPADHTSIIIVGNERTGLWKKAFGLAQTEEILKVVTSVLEDRD